MDETAVETESGSRSSATGRAAVGADFEPDSHFNHLKEEILAEMPARWKTCLFHPVWAAISAILFLGALLMPHSNRRPDVYPNSPPSRFPSSPIRHLPPFQSGDKNPAPAVYAQPKPPILAEAAESLDFPLKGDPVFILPFPSGESPILLKRPRAVDTRQLALDLAVLAGLQIGGGEWGDAGESIDLLRRYSPETAGKLGEMLTAALAESQVSLDSVTAANAPESPIAEAEPAAPVPESPAAIEPDPEAVAITGIAVPTDSVTAANAPESPIAEAESAAPVPESPAAIEPDPEPVAINEASPPIKSPETIIPGWRTILFKADSLLPHPGRHRPFTTDPYLRDD